MPCVDQLAQPEPECRSDFNPTILFRALRASIGSWVAKKGGFGAWSFLALVCYLTAPLSAQTTGTSGNFTYSDDGTSITITGYPTNAVGDVAVPSTINDKPVTGIGGFAFYGCVGLTSVSIPSSVTTIGNGAFSSCTGLVSLSVDAANPNYSSSDGVLFNKLQTTLIVCPVTKSGVYSIPSSVNTIGYDAFSDCTMLTGVSIPSSVTTVGEIAFNRCTGLTSVTIPPSVTTIGYYAFSGCTGLTDVSIPSSVTAIGLMAFSGCTGLVTFSVDAANPNYSSLDGVLFNKLQASLIKYPAGKSGAYTIPSSVTTIEDGAFSGCARLTSISIPSSVTTIGVQAFSDCTGLASVSIPSSITTISERAFSGCIALTSVSIPSSVTSIGGSAFSYCTGLTSVAIPSSVSTIGSQVFFGCDGLTSVSIPSGVTTIGDYAFAYCTGLTSVAIPSSVTTIESYAFSDCTSLTSVSIPSGVTSIGSSAFSGCTALVSFSVDAANPNYSSLDGVLFNKLHTSLIQCPAGKSGDYTIPASVTSIGSYAFYGCTTLTGVSTPSSITSIGNYAFYGCTALTSVSISSSVTTIGSYAFYGCAGLTGVSIPSGVLTLGDNAFYDCTGLTSISIPSSVTTIGSNAFYGCTALVSFTVDAANPNYSSSSGVLFNKLQTLLIQYPSVKTGVYTIPSGVTTIGSNAFSRSTGLTAVAIPSSVTNIGSSPFFGCTALASISVDAANPNYSSLGGVLFNKLQTSLIRYPEGMSGVYTAPSSVTSISDSAFYGCIGLTSVSIPSSVTTIESYAFFGCTGLTSVLLSTGVTNIGSLAFYGCNGLTNVEIPASVTNIGFGAFANCAGLVSLSVDSANPSYSSLDGVLFNKPANLLISCPSGKSGDYTIPSGVTRIADRAFSECTQLTSVSIPSAVSRIGGAAFFGCTGLTGVSIPSSVTTIEIYAFYGCLKLTRAIFTGNAPTVDFFVFAQTASGFTVYYLSGSSGFTSPTWKGYAAFPMEQPQFTGSPPTTTGTLGVSYYYSSTATGVPPPAFSVTSGTLPDGLSISSTGVISGTPTVAGTFSGTITATNEAAPDATQAFTITINTALQTWRQTYFGTTANTGTAADSAVSNLDGLPNLIEYALGGTPTVANSTIPPKLGTVTSDDETYLTLTFTPQRSDITYAIEVTGDLTGAWTRIPLTGLLTMGQAYTHTDTIAVATGAPRFIRLSVSGQ
jgi:hypothetical protein